MFQAVGSAALPTRESAAPRQSIPSGRSLVSGLASWTRRGLLAIGCCSVLAGAARPPLAAAQSGAALTILTPTNNTVLGSELTWSGTGPPRHGIVVCAAGPPGFSEVGSSIAGADGTFSGSTTLLASRFANFDTLGIIFLDTGAGPIANTACVHPGLAAVARVVILPGGSGPPPLLSIVTPAEGAFVGGAGLSWSGTALPGHAVVVCAAAPSGYGPVGFGVADANGAVSGVVSPSLLVSSSLNFGALGAIFVDAAEPPIPSSVCDHPGLAAVARAVTLLDTIPPGGGDGGGGRRWRHP
jgi:hypothetical protein